MNFGLIHTTVAIPQLSPTNYCPLGSSYYRYPRHGQLASRSRTPGIFPPAGTDQIWGHVIRHSADRFVDRTNPSQWNDIRGSVLRCVFGRNTIFQELIYVLGIFTLLTAQAATALMQRPRCGGKIANNRLVLLFYIFITFALGTICHAANAKFTEMIWIDLRDAPGGPLALIENALDYRINIVALFA